jgi:hypothetical protein
VNGFAATLLVEPERAPAERVGLSKSLLLEERVEWASPSLPGKTQGHVPWRHAHKEYFLNPESGHSLPAATVLRAAGAAIPLLGRCDYFFLQQQAPMPLRRVQRPSERRQHGARGLWSGFQCLSRTSLEISFSCRTMCFSASRTCR